MTDLAREVRVSLGLALLLLLTLAVVKPLAGLPYVGQLLVSIAAVMQLYVPLWRMQKLGRGYEFVGLSRQNLRADLMDALWVMALLFPLFVVGHHLYMTELHDLLVRMGQGAWARWIPRGVFSPRLPDSALAWGLMSLRALEVVAIHTIGVALPEETFYRGYLFPSLARRWPIRSFWSSLCGRAALVSSALFAIGHVVGEWNPLRFGPFFPALVFCGLASRRQSIWGAIAFHAASNILGQLLYGLYRNVP